jgi:hypothetical protein
LAKIIDNRTIMTSRITLPILVLLGLGWLPLASAEQPAGQPLTPPQLEFFEKEIRPLLVAHCFECHSSDADELGGGLRLDTRTRLLQGGDSGPAAQPGNPGNSLFIRAIKYTDPLLQMPPSGRLTEREIAALIKWVDIGLPYPRADAGQPRNEQPPHTTADTQSWWSFQRSAEPPSLPAVQDPTWPSNAIDRFVLAQLETQEFRPAPAADRRTLIRRATFDLIGLPPTPDEVSAFLADSSPDAFARRVDRLLGSHHYGERWGRHWLDVVRYADTSGCNGDFPVPEAFRYRNYVIDSWNADKPYDEFVREQIAGDLLPAESDEIRYQRLIATGYLAISRRFSSLGEEFHLTLDDTVDNLGKAILGLTISCARCHAHKFDPIPQTDYYALYGIFQSTRYSFPGTEIYRHTRHLAPLVPRSLAEQIGPTLAEIEQLDEQIFETYSTMAALDTGEKKDALRKDWGKLKIRRDELTKATQSFDKAFAASEGEPVNVRLHIKGDPKNLGPTIPRGFLQVLGGHRLSADEPGSGRLQLADWLTSAQNPLTARVIVNRVWQHHFGQGLVRTPNDFGTRGSPPTHPQLLDYLTYRFLKGGWSIKDLHREIMLSRTYQMGIVERASYSEADPDNRYLWTFPRRRLDAEAIRDSMLAISGALDRSQGGPHPFEPEWEWRYSQHVPFVDDFPTRRRTVYLMQQRIRQQPYLAVFDGADTNVATGGRQVSTTPQQALFMLNSEFVHEQAERFAEFLSDTVDGETGQVQFAYQLALGRPPDERELVEAIEFIGQARAEVGRLEIADAERPVEALASYLRVLLSSNEFMFVE